MKKAKVGKRSRAPQRSRKRRTAKLRPAGYLAARLAQSCTGLDCSRYKLNAFVGRTLVRITPQPAAGAEAAVRTDAQLALRTLLADALGLLRDLSMEGNLFGVVIMQLIRGFGGDQVCRNVSADCECRLDVADPMQTTTLPFDVAVPFNSGGVEYTADFNCPWELQVVRGTCAKPI